ncbi:MAG: alpha/beta hydrolase [Leptospiraceae bacterium]|nr:alpha/beta hydrolase [Leptospiraceae bacterium]
MNNNQGKGRKKSILIVAGLVLLLIGGFQVLANTFPEFILRGMYRYYAFRADLTSEVVSVDGYSIPYYRGGTGPTLVLIHGFGDSKISFLQTAAFLTDSYDVILIDVPGFGDTEHDANRSYDIRTQANSLHAFLQKVGAEEVFLAGNSMGGHIGAAYTLMHPNRVKKLVLMNAAGLRVDDPVPYKPSAAPLRTVEEFDNYVSETFVRQPFIPHAFKLHFVSNSIKNFDWLNGIRKDIRQGQDYILNQRAASIQTQTLILWGDSDTIVSPAHAQVWSRLLPNSVLIILDDTGHAPQYERPEDTARILKSFLL